MHSPWAFKIRSFALAGLGHHWASSITGLTTLGLPSRGLATMGLGHLQGLDIMGNPPQASSRSGLPPLGQPTVLAAPQALPSSFSCALPTGAFKNRFFALTRFRPPLGFQHQGLGSP
jgi:hypothetical protein